MANRALLLLAAFLAAAGLAEGLRREAGHNKERPQKAQKSEKKKEKASLGSAFKKFFQDETTTQKPTWMGMPVYYEGRLPWNYANMTHMAKQDFFFRMERWHELEEERKESGKCRAPKPGEKVVYFVQHGDCVPKTDDAPLWELGLYESQNIRWDPLMAKALSANPKYRPQVVIVSPARKALQTAIIGFADILPEASFEIDPDVRGFGFVEGTLVPQLGAAALYDMSSQKKWEERSLSLLSQYRDLPKGWEKATKPHKDRFFDLMEHILERPEERFVVVTHNGMIKQANATKSHQAQVTMRSLLPDRTWRKLSPPDCWPEEA